MGKCKFKTEDGWKCPLEAEPGKKYCYWHKEEEGKSPDKEQLEVLKTQEIKGVYLREAHLQGVNLVKAHLKSADLEEAHLEGADLEEAHLEGVLIVGANLKGVYLKVANLKGAHLEVANLKGAYLKVANLEGAFLGMANLEGAGLEGANLEGAFLREANLQGVNLVKAHLEGADLRGTDLKGADLREARVDGKTNFASSDLSFSNLSFSYIDGTKTLRNAIFKSKREINEIAADLLRKKRSKIVVLDANRIEEDHSGLYELLRRTGAMRYTAEDRLFFFDREKRCFVRDPGGERIETKEVEGIAENLDKYLLQNPPEGDKKDPKKYKKNLLINLYDASYDVFNMLYYFYIQNGKLDEAIEMHERRSDVRRKLLMARGGLKNKIRAVLYDYFILKGLTGYGVKVFRPILISIGTIILFALLFWATGGIVKTINGISYKPTPWDYFYHSIITFTSLGYSNIVPNLGRGPAAQCLVAAESIFGAFLIALIIFTITYRVSK